MAGEMKIAVKFLVDKENSRVVLAEADKDFVDILFSFLTLPLGTIVKILHKKSSLGCIDNLYKSVDNLDIKYLQTEACKTMLLHPRSEGGRLCEDLKVNVADTKPRDVYVCKKDDCGSKQTCLNSSVRNAQCIHCKEPMDYVCALPKVDVGDGNLFVKRGFAYMISDDIHVVPASVMHSLSLLQKMSINNGDGLEESQMHLGTEEILTLLRGLLISETPLTNLYLQKQGMTKTNDSSHNIGDEKTPQVKKEHHEETYTNSEGISIKLLINKPNNRVLCVVTGEDFINLIFSFLTLPLGTLIKILNNKSDIVCLDNLYGSATQLSLQYIQSEECRRILLSPKLGSFFGCSNNMLKLDEEDSYFGLINGCFSCYRKNKSKDGKSVKCCHGVAKAEFKELNPKSPQGSTENGGRYVKGPGKFVVTDDLCVSPFSSISTVKMIGEADSSFDNVVEREVQVGEAQVLELLRAAIKSRTPLNDVFSPLQNRTKRSNAGAFVQERNVRSR